MPTDASVVADPTAGIAVVAGRRVAMRTDDATGTVRFGGAAGSVLRPLAFGERTRMVSEAAALAFARDAVAAAVLRAATVERGSGETTLLEVLALWLAGAAWEAPGFNATTLLVARAAGWPPHELFSAPAREVDRLAIDLDEARQAGEWKRIVFTEPPEETLEQVRARFADRLLRRVHRASVPATPSSEVASSPRSGSPPGRAEGNGATAAGRPDRQAGSLRDAAAATDDPRNATTDDDRNAAPPAEAFAAPPSRGEKAVSFRPGSPSLLEHGAPAADAPPSCRPPGGPPAWSPRDPAPRGTAGEAAHPPFTARLETLLPFRTDAALRASSQLHGQAESPRYGTAALAAAAAAPRAAGESVSVAESERSSPGSGLRFGVDRRHAPAMPFAGAAREAGAAPREHAGSGDDVARLLAALLDDEADLRGVER